jgi:hypothetical protein
MSPSLFLCNLPPSPLDLLSCDTKTSKNASVVIMMIMMIMMMMCDLLFTTCLFFTLTTSSTSTILWHWNRPFVIVDCDQSDHLYEHISSIMVTMTVSKKNLPMCDTIRLKKSQPLTDCTNTLTYCTVRTYTYVRTQEHST